MMDAGDNSLERPRPKGWAGSLGDRQSRTVRGADPEWVRGRDRESRYLMRAVGWGGEGAPQ